MRLILFLVCITAASLAAAQDLTGIWRGSFNSTEKIYSALNISDRYKFEVQIDDSLNKRFSGVTYSYKNTVFYGKAVVSGTINPKTGKVMLQELKIVELKMQGSGGACIMTCFLQYFKNGDEEFLEGKYSSYHEFDSSDCGKGTVILRKVSTSDFYKEPFIVKHEAELARKKAIASRRKTSPPVAKAAPPKTTTKPKETTAPANKPADRAVTRTPVPKVNKDPERTTPKTATVSPREIPLPPKKVETIIIPQPLATRANEVVKTLLFSTNEVIINVYDNGTIDHDTISIYLDKKLIVSRQMLTTAPITIKLNLDDNSPVHELVMVAENLGDIPPNTSLMVVKAADKQYEVRITSTEQKNAVIIFRYEKP